MERAGWLMLLAGLAPVSLGAPWRRFAVVAGVLAVLGSIGTGPAAGALPAPVDALHAPTATVTGQDIVYTVAGSGGAHGLRPPAPATSVGGLAPADVVATANGGFVLATRHNRGLTDGLWSVDALGVLAPLTSLRPPAGLSALAYEADGSLLATVPELAKVERVSREGAVETAAGNGARPVSGDGGPATLAGMDPEGVSATAEGGFLIADAANNRIRRVAPDGTITTVAGSGPAAGAFTPGGFGGDGGPATAALLNHPARVAATDDGGFLIVDTQNYCVRRVAPDGTITTVAGIRPDGMPGAGTPATSIKLVAPSEIMAQPGGGFLLADGAWIYRVGANGEIAVLAGRGVQLSAAGQRFRQEELRVPDPFDGDGRPAAEVEVTPSGMAVTADGGLLVAGGGSVRFVAPTSTSRLSAALTHGWRAAGRRAQVRYAITMPAHVVIDLLAKGHRVARMSDDTTAGTNEFTTPPLRPGVTYTLKLAARSAAGAIATDEAALRAGGLLERALARRLTVTYARSKADLHEGDSAFRRCRRIRRGRVDCRADWYDVDANARHDFNVAWYLRRDGQIYYREYLGRLGHPMGGSPVTPCLSAASPICAPFF
jgi:hypothetical protein